MEAEQLLRAGRRPWRGRCPRNPAVGEADHRHRRLLARKVGQHGRPGEADGKGRARIGAGQHLRDEGRHAADVGDKPPAGAPEGAGLRCRGPGWPGPLAALSAANRTIRAGRDADGLAVLVVEAQGGRLPPPRAVARAPVQSGQARTGRKGAGGEAHGWVLWFSDLRRVTEWWRRRVGHRRPWVGRASVLGFQKRSQGQQPVRQVSAREKSLARQGCRGTEAPTPRIRPALGGEEQRQRQATLRPARRNRPSRRRVKRAAEHDRQRAGAGRAGGRGRRSCRAGVSVMAVIPDGRCRNRQERSEPVCRFAVHGWLGWPSPQGACIGHARAS